MIVKVRDTVTEFLEKAIVAEAVRVVSINGTAGGWVAEAEAAEKNQYLASIHPDYRVIEKEHYIIKLNENLEVLSYKRTEKGEDD